MRIEKLSLKALTVTVLMIIAIVAVATGFVSEREYREAALKTQARTETRILRVASDAALGQMQSAGIQLAAAAAKALARQPHLTSNITEAPAGTSNPTLTQLLSAPLATEIEGLKPLSAALYNEGGQRLMVAGEAQTLDSRILEARSAQQATGMLWQSKTGPRYTVLQPVGNKTASGYLAISFDPVYALQSVAQLTNLPLRIAVPDADVLYESGDWSSRPQSVHEVTY